ncbi:MAG: NAD-dependent epimerase/dehydratase family protein [Hyphomicrobiales bacterium]
MRFAVLGASGFIGNSVVSRLASEGNVNVTAFTRELPAARHSLRLPSSSVTWATLDLIWDDCEMQGLDSFDVLVDCSGMVNVRDAGAAARFQESVANQLRRIEHFCRRGCSAVIGLSSGGTVYGNASVLPIPETHPANPISQYGKSKLAYENGVFRLAEVHGLDTACVFRVANACGAGQRSVGGFGLIPTVTQSLMTGGTITVAGDGTALRDYIDVADIADAIVLAALARPGRTVLNLGSGVGRSTNDVISALAAICGREPAVSHIPAPSDMIRHNVLDIARINQVLGWRPRVEFERSLRSYVQSYKLFG